MPTFITIEQDDLSNKSLHMTINKGINKSEFTFMNETTSNRADIHPGNQNN